MPLTHYPSMYPEGERLSGAGRFLVLDSEAIDLLFGLRKNDPSSMHCIVVKDDLTNEVFIFFDPYEKRDPANRVELEMEGEQDGYLYDGIKFLQEAECLISQNFSGYDALAFEKVLGEHWKVDYMARRKEDDDRSWYYPNKIMDTYIMSCVLNPERKVPGNAYALGRGNVGPHSIEAHGIRMGRFKPENEDWSKLTDHMLHRCEEDVHIGQDYYHYLMKEWNEQAQRPNAMTGLSINTAYRCELQVAFSIARQAQRGFAFDVEKAVNRVEELTALIDETERGFRPHMPMRIAKAKLASPVNGHTHGSKYTTVNCITKKLAGKAWCDFSQSSKYPHELREEAYLLLDSGLKITQKDWLAVCPAIQDNSVGEYAAAVTKHYPECRGFITDYKDPIVVGEFTPIQWEEIPLGNRDAVKQVLYEHGWLGVNYNDTEQALIDDGREEELDPWAGKIDETSLELWKQRDGSIPSWCEGIAAWYILNSRRNQIINVKDLEYYKANDMWPRQQSGKHECRGLVAKCRHTGLGITAQQYFEQHKKWPTEDKGEWRVPSEAFSCATNTFRMRHKVVVNIPSRGLYPLRDLFIAGKGKKVLGCDGAGLELRMLSHFMNDPVYQEVVLNGDIHSYNQEKAGLPLRDMAKTFIYAFLYGSGVKNLAAVCGVSAEEMEQIMARFKAELPALTNLIERLQRQGEAVGYLLSVDGRWGRIRSKNGKLLVHTMLNVLLQMTGSISMKYGMCFAERQLEREGVALDSDGFVAWLVNMHDEVQTEINAHEVEYMEYRVHAEKWKAEEKRVHYDEQGRMWSAPKIKERVHSDGFEDIIVTRAYHRAGQVIAESFTKAGQFLKLRCPLAGEYKIGDSWADTH